MTDYLEKIGEIDIEAAGVLAAKLEAEGSAVINVEGADFTITKDQVSFKKETKKIHGYPFQWNIGRSDDFFFGRAKLPSWCD